MSDDWKYIVFYMNEFVGETAIVFPPNITHLDVKNAFHPAAPMGAGFVKLDPNTKKFYCYGRSDSIRVESRPEDAVFINLMVQERL